MPTKPVSVSAIIPVYNGAAFLAEAIESIRRQAYDPLEIIVVDDGSTDDTSTVAARFPNVRYIFQENGGPPAARNRGLKAVNGELIAFLDADDLWSEDKLKAQLAHLAAAPSMEIVLGRRQNMRLTGVVDGRLRFEISSDPLTALSLGCGLFRRSVFEKVGRFDETLRHCDDWDWFMRARERSVAMEIRDEVVLFCRRHDRNITERKEVNDAHLIKMLKQSLDRRRRNHGVARSLPQVSSYQWERAARPGTIAEGRKPPARPLVSVVVPVYNGERFLAAALDSIFAQDYRPLEVIVVDDGSLDGTAAVAKSYGELRYIHQANQGHGTAKNAGIAAATGEFLAFLDADDLWAPRKLSLQIGYLLKHPEAGYVTARARNFVEPGTPRPQRMTQDLLLTEHAGLYVSTLVARRTALAKIGDFDPSYAHANDTDWFFRAKEAGMPMTILPEILLYRRLHAANRSYRTEPRNSEFLRAVKSSMHRKRKRDSARRNDGETLVSVIIPVYNCERYLGEAIESALRQSYRPLEIIVVDDGSTDDSGQVAQSFGSAVRYCLQPHAGIGAARNRGVDAARGRYLAFLDADDLWTEDKLALQTAAFDRDPGLDIAFGHVRHFHSPDLPEEAKKKIYCPTVAMPGYSCSTMLVTRAAFSRVGPFEVSWQVGEFIDWYARARQIGLKSIVLPDVLLRRRLHAANQGIVQRWARTDYVRVLKAALDRRRNAARDGGEGSANDDEPKG